MSHISHFKSLERKEEAAAQHLRRQTRSSRRPGRVSQGPGTGNSEQADVAVEADVTPSTTAFRRPGLAPLRTGPRARASILDYGGGAATPAAQTPAGRFFSRHQQYSRAISFQPDFEAANEAEDNKEEVQKLCHRSWQLYRVSPLFGLNYSDEFLRTWEKVLAQDVAEAKESFVEEKQRADDGDDVDQAAGLQDYRALSVSIRTVPGIRGCQSDARALQIRVSCRRARTELATAFLLATDAQDLDLTPESGRKSRSAREDEEGKDPVAVALPVLLLWGSRPLALALVDNIQRCFDCIVGKAPFTQDDLRWASAMWVGLGEVAEEEEEEEEARKEGEAGSDEQHKEKKKPKDNSVTFTYSVPPALMFETARGGKMVVQLELKQKEVSGLWKSIHDPKETVATVDEVELFHSSLAAHLQRSVNVRLGLLDLRRVDLPALTLEASGKVQVGSADHVKTVLRLLTSICQLHLESTAPRMGINSGETILS